jgi:hypothetical protein
MGSLFSVVELPGLDHVDDDIGGQRQFEDQFLLLIGVGLQAGAWVRRLPGGERQAFGLLDLGQAASLVFFAAAAEAGIIPSDLGYFSTSA